MELLWVVAGVMAAFLTALAIIGGVDIVKQIKRLK